jgi:hypothetical protein
VIVRALGDTATTGRVWDVSGEVVFVTSEANFDRLTRRMAGPPPIGFPAADVFIFEPGALENVRSSGWGILRAWPPGMSNVSAIPR